MQISSSKDSARMFAVPWWPLWMLIGPGGWVWMNSFSCGRASEHGRFVMLHNLCLLEHWKKIESAVFFVKTKYRR